MLEPNKSSTLTCCKELIFTLDYLQTFKIVSLSLEHTAVGASIWTYHTDQKAITYE